MDSFEETDSSAVIACPTGDLEFRNSGQQYLDVNTRRSKAFLGRRRPVGFDLQKLVPIGVIVLIT